MTEVHKEKQANVGGILGEGTIEVTGLTDQGKGGHLFFGKSTRQEIF